MSKKRYFNGITALTNKLEKNKESNIQDYSSNPNIILSEAELYKPNYDYSLISMESERDTLFKYEFTIVNSLKSISKNYKEVCEKLYLAQILLVNHDKTLGMFYDWFNSMGLDKNFVYRCLDRYQVFLETNKEIYLSQDVSVRTIQLVKKIDDIHTKIEVADKIKDKEISSSKSLQNYLVSRVRQDIYEVHQEKISKSNIQLTRTNKQILIKLKGCFTQDEFLEISNLIESYISNRENLPPSPGMVV